MPDDIFASHTWRLFLQQRQNALLGFTVSHPVKAVRHGIIAGMDERLSKLAKAAAASMRGASVDSQWIYEESLALSEQSQALQTNALWRILVDCASSLNDVGEYALGGEIFELVLNHAREGPHRKIEFDALEGLARSWFYMGDKDRAFRHLDEGLELATRLRKRLAVERFQNALTNYHAGKIVFPPGKIRAPTGSGTTKPKRQAHISTLLKKERNR